MNESEHNAGAGSAALTTPNTGGAASTLTTHHSSLATGHWPLATAKVGMLCFLLTEVAFFSTLIVTYLIYLERSRPIAHELLRLPLVMVSSLCLFASSWTVHKAMGALPGDVAAFRKWLAATVVLGALFLVGTAKEWHELIFEHGLTMSRNIFGSTYFTLVGFHAAHVTIGVVMLATVLGLARGQMTAKQETGAELVSWYWHFVDAVWVVVFIVVYLVGR
jgi:cytochrome c oxidase subunit 3/cytochrome o ubiquinol oxidase subunit 3